ncbi:MAG TPA: LPP20 family lipoprotein [Nitrospiraceae bacterium]|nr:LPP20 family lipoprotein [Nitrospiraceae bacterium]
MACLGFFGLVWPGGIAASAESYTDEHYIVGVGHGELSKGRIVCQRLAELAARADVARQIRVLVKEQIRDRVRERTGRDLEQDIEIVREEEAKELLRNVRIVERRVDATTGICIAHAAMRKRDVIDTPPQ